MAQTTWLGLKTRSYEEVEKRRSEEMSGESRDPRSGRALLVIFFAFAVLTIYLLVVPYLASGPVNFTFPEATALVSLASLFGYRVQARRKRHGKGGAKPVVLDTLAFLGIVALAAWTFVFPILYPLPQETAIIGVYSLILLAAMIVVLRFTQPTLRGRTDDAYSDIESSLKQLGKAVEQLSKRNPQGEKSADPAAADRLSTMMAEVAAMKKELSTIKSGAQTPSVNAGVSSLRVMSTQVKPVLVPRSPEGQVPPEKLAVVKPEGKATWTGDGGVSVPESTVDNPWLDVLAKRRAKKDQ